jgi:hypothetical protein
MVAGLGAGSKAGAEGGEMTIKTMLLLLVALVLGLVLVAQPVSLPRLDGYWWTRSSEHDKALYVAAFADGGGRVGSSAAIDRFYSDQAALDVSLKDALHTIWGEAQKR